MFEYFPAFRKFFLFYMCALEKPAHPLTSDTSSTYIT